MKRGGAVARPMLGQPKANSARAARERRSKGESERAAMATGPVGARGEVAGWASGPNLRI
jgi:hypothetical protein